MKIVFSLLVLSLFLVGCEKDTEKEKKEAIIQMENKTAIITKELASRNMLSSASRYATLCDFQYNKSWCKGYFTAVYISIENSGMTVCAPKRQKSQRVIFEGAWSIVKRSLLALPEDSQVRFYETIISALTESEHCT